MRACSSWSRISLIAPTPSSSGIRKSSRVTSGRCCFHKLTASWPLVASPSDHHVRLAPNQRDQTFAHHGMVIGDENTDARFFGVGFALRCPGRSEPDWRFDAPSLPEERVVVLRARFRFRFHDLDSPL